MSILMSFGFLLLGVGMGVLIVALVGANGRAQDDEDLARLRAFAQDILRDWPDVGYFDGFDLQQIAHKHGLLIAETRFKPCGERCTCTEMVDQTEWDDGVTCFRKCELIKGAAA